jgi:nucleoside-diphosphate-sugar epimerase
MNIFVAGATGVIGRPLVTLLVRAGHSVTGSTRSAAKAADISALGATPAVVDAFDAAALTQAVAAARPQVVIHQLTDLPDSSDPASMAASRARNSKLRIEGTANLVAAARAAGAKRLVAQSIAFIYAPGLTPHRETDPLMSGEGDSPDALSARGVRALEDGVMGAAGLEGIVLRYGRLYGPGTWFDKPGGPGPLTTGAAAQAALLAVSRGAPGIYNIAEDDGAVSIEKARRDLGFDPAFRLQA